MPETASDARVAAERDSAATALAERFTSLFGRAPAALAAAPGRINLLGEHTDYNGGLVLPSPLPLWTRVAVAPLPEAADLAIHSMTQDTTVRRSPAAGPAGDWSDYVTGCLSQLGRQGQDPGGLALAVQSDIPMGAGVSSSAALEIATLRAVAALRGVALTGAELAAAGQAAERNFVGMPCGIMDQMAVACCAPGEALYLDCASLVSRRVPLPAAWSFAVIHSGVSHRLVEGDYGRRHAECAEAARKLGVAALGELSSDDARLDQLDPPLRQRARHVATENARVVAGVAALEAGDAERFGTLMAASHASLRDDFAVSIPELDRVVAACQAAGAYGARLTGGGFGGAVLALRPAGASAAWSRETAGRVAGAWAVW